MNLKQLIEQIKGVSIYRADYCKYCVVVTVGSPGADVRPRPAGAVSKSVADLHLELFLDETKKLAQSVVECIKENGVDKSVDEVSSAAVLNFT